MHAFALVVVTHQSTEWLASLAQTWSAAALAAAMPGIPVIIADSGSTDGTAAAAEKLFPAAQVMRLDNRGYGAAANAASGKVVAEWVLLCNPDVSFSTDFVRQAHAACSAAASDVACIVPQLLNADGTTQASVGRFPTLGGILRDQFRPRPRRKYVFPQPAASGPVAWASGACLLLRRAAFLGVGGFDENFFLYAEEVDLQRRLGAAGRRIWFEPALKLIHHAPNAARPGRPEVQRYAARGILRYFAKFGGTGALTGYRMLGLLSGRLSAREALASRRTILQRPTGP